MLLQQSDGGALGLALRGSSQKFRLTSACTLPAVLTAHESHHQLSKEKEVGPDSVVWSWVLLPKNWARPLAKRCWVSPFLP